MTSQQDLAPSTQTITKGIEMQPIIQIKKLSPGGINQEASAQGTQETKKTPIPQRSGLGPAPFMSIADHPQERVNTGTPPLRHALLHSGRMSQINSTHSIQQEILNEVLNCEADIQSSQDIPVIDALPILQYSKDHQQTPQWLDCMQELEKALKEVGFFTLTNHGLDAAGAKKASNAFFKQTLSEKMARAQRPDFPFGYSCVGEEQLSLSEEANGTSSPNQPEGDPKESLNIPPLHLPWAWPVSTLGFDATQFQEEMTEYYQNCEAFANTFLQSLAHILKEPSDFFTDKMQEHMSVVRTLNYPASNHNPLTNTQKVRASAHTDYGLLTLLQTFGSQGLQVQNKAGEWINVRLTNPDDLVINIGDALGRMTNNAFKSTRHRVIQFDSAQRQSIAFFVNFNDKALIEPTQKYRKSSGNYPPVASGTYIMHKSELAMGYAQQHGKKTESKLTIS